MEASAGILFRFPSVTGTGAGVNTKSFHRGSNLSTMLSLKSKKFMGYYDEGYLEYYSSGRIRCGKKEKDMVLKKTKKKMKLLKGLSRNLNEMGFGIGIGLVDQVQGKTISEAADLLLGQLQQLKAEEKELKRKRKEEKALMKMKGANQVQGTTRNCEMPSSSSSSSESSDDECQNLVDMKNLKLESLAQTIPEACDRALENATLSPGISTTVEPLNPEVDTSVEISTTSTSSLEVPGTLKLESLAQTIPEACDRALENATLSPGISTTVEPLNPEVDTSVEISTTSTSSLEVPVPEQKGECCLEASDCHIGNVSSSSNASVLATTTLAVTKKIEVCMGGKCKRSGAGAILEKFQKVVGIEAAVSGCKCMGKCKVGPNVKVSGCSSSSGPDAFQAGDSVAVSSAPTSSINSLCIGVGLEDVSLIAANLLGRYQEVGLANAVP
ncbi:hypothetical protein K7X08_027139 [Anisodus acutangulus]|uniref:Uncharacterized protein n=1 Tax=Anisodus acutangulus TaxID=402998 RepID=A0A9Q1MM93_9SOLA|nr:hypothetical protein K7X08_027139 [Anisodus acutangulus]